MHKTCRYQRTFFEQPSISLIFLRCLFINRLRPAVVLSLVIIPGNEFSQYTMRDKYQPPATRNLYYIIYFTFEIRNIQSFFSGHVVLKCDLCNIRKFMIIDNVININCTHILYLSVLSNTHGIHIQCIYIILYMCACVHDMLSVFQ